MWVRTLLPGVMLGLGCAAPECDTAGETCTAPEPVPIPPDEEALGPEAEPPPGAGPPPLLPCEKIPHDPKLGTLRLHTDFIALETARLPQDLSHLTAVPTQTGFSLYGIRGTSKTLHRLGTWPHLALSEPPLLNVIAPEDRRFNPILSPFLVNDGRRLMTGYIHANTRGNGSVLIHDLEAPSTPLYVPAPGNVSAAAMTGSAASGVSGFLVSGMGLAQLGSVNSDSAVYGLKTLRQPVRATPLATFAPEWAAVSSVSVFTSNGIAVLGYFSGMDTQEHLRAVPSTAQATALATGTPLSLSDWPEIYSGHTEAFFASAFGNGLAIHRGTRAGTQEVRWIPLTHSSTELSAVQAGPPLSLLSSRDTCTRVTRLVPLGSDLLAGIADKAGERLVRLHKP
ncbi:hypothetical protein POL68_27345 [Stigmatella sp. ncwal1]|uniref:Lipoprotein n=1 Tax=Stigmatella ashevillensis TaxID=2995309 RepID=A0ABT5DGI1_9BACT|nr:hypothetical protein [Stigmatella ashevillena]MDC0712213.1 hypothetical protein [Stigmatella ashevillena]